MQRLRFRRYAQIFKEGLDLGLPHGLDLYSVLYDKGASQLLNPALRKDLLEFCYPSTKLADKTNLHPIFAYFVILEANDNPYTVTERIDNSTLDKAFDYSRMYLVKDDISNRRDDKTWTRIAFHLAKYFQAIS